MTDDHLDDLASAYLDGVASPQDAARVEADPAALARVAELATVRAALRQDPVVDPARREAALAAALAAFEDDAAPTDAPVASVLTAPAARWAWSSQTVRWVGAAAAVLALAALVPLLSRLGDDDASQAGRFEETGAAIGGAAGDDTLADGSGGTRSEANDAARPTTTAAGAFDRGVDLGAFDTVDDLLAALAGSESSGYDATAPQVAPEAAVDRGACPTHSSPAGATTTWRSARVADEPALVVIVRGDDGDTTVTVYRLSDCLRLGGGPLP